MADRSTVKPMVIIDDVTVSVDSCEYLTDCVVLQPKMALGGYPLILGRP